MKKGDKTAQLAKLLEEKGVSHAELKRLLSARKKKLSPKVVIPKTKSVYRFGVVSDTHLVDKTCALSELHSFYERCKRDGITEVVHSGDFATGQTVYKGQINDIVCFGYDAHLDFLVDNYPKVEGITTYAIGGNHDEDYKKAFGADILAGLALRRPDIKYLGMYDAILELNGILIQLHHGAGNAYALSYKLQKYIEALGAGRKPQIFICGHYHAVLYMFLRNIHAFLPGCWQKPNDFSVRHMLPNMLGGWIIELEIADDAKNSITKITPTFVPFYG